MIFFVAEHSHLLQIKMAIFPTIKAWQITFIPDFYRFSALKNL